MRGHQGDDDSSFIINVSRNDDSPSIMKFMEKVNYYIDIKTYKVK
jgi:hypothetical protein